MAIYQVYSQSLTVKYKSTLFSKSTIFSVVITVFSLVLPFLLAYRSHEFWLRVSSYREQPLVAFKHEYMLYIETEDYHSPILCSSLQITQEFHHCTLVKSREDDRNGDGYRDILFMDFEVQVPLNLSVYSVQLLLIFDYKLQKRCLFHMEGAGFIQYNSGLPFRNLEMNADLKLVQKRLLRSDIADTEYNKSIFHTNDNYQGGFPDINQAINNYFKRDVHTKMENVMEIWQRGVLVREPFILSVRILYPEETIYYTPTFWQIIKWAWMQYLSLVIISLFFSRLIKQYVFANHLVSTYKETPLNCNN